MNAPDCYTVPENDWAEVLFAHDIIKYQIEDAIDEHLKDAPATVLRIWWDHYDASIELGFSPSTPSDWKADSSLWDLIAKWGFGQAYLNYTDGTQQFMSSRQGVSERKVWNDNSHRWNEKKASEYT